MTSAPTGGRGATVATMAEARTETMTVNMGPQHPSTHGVLRLVLELDGEVVRSASPTIGYLHTGIEKTAEQKKWQQVIPLVERMDYLSAQSNSLAFAMSVERLLGVEIPERVRWIRVLIAELQRINSHLVWLGTHGMEVGAVSVMLYCFRERELLLNVNEMLAGFRMFPSYIRVGGLREDLPRGFHDAIRAFLERFGPKLDEYEDLLTRNEIYVERTRGVGVISKDDALAYGLVGPIARASGVDYDVRKYFPYLGYDTFEFSVPTREQGDVYSRYLVRVAEMRESAKICRQALDRISPSGPFAIEDPRITPPPKDRVYTEMEALIQHFLIYSQGFTVPAGEAYVPIEGPRGEQGFTVVSDGTNRPWRVKSRAPSLLACQALERMIVGGLIADVIAVIGSIDVVMGDVDR
jgi:NADH-quinone oxidoreductase subunit D